MAKKICILVSGGVDSALLLQEGLEQGHELFPLFVRVGFAWENAELHWLQRLLKHLETTQLHELTGLESPLNSLFPQHWAFNQQGVPDAASPDQAVYLPGRNLFLLTQAAVFCQAHDLEEIWIGVLKGNPFGDGQPEFFRRFEAICSLAFPKSLQILAPFQSLNKNELVRRYPNFPFLLTFSCLNPSGLEPCGTCNKCEERRKGLQGLALTNKLVSDA